MVGTELPSAQGFTEADQDKIDDTVARLCAVRVYNKDECDEHTLASARRFNDMVTP